MSKKQIPASLERRKGDRPYFDSQMMPKIGNYYVCWFDLMGAQSIMRRSIIIATNFVMKIHIASQNVLQKEHHDVELFPVIDGIYIVSRRQSPLLFFLKSMMSRLALTFIFEEQHIHRFLVRGAIAFGPLSLGSTLTRTSNCLTDSMDYCKRIALGIPLSQAYDDEKNAAPFGIYLSECARSFSPADDEVLGGTHWEWWRQANSAEDNEIVDFLKSTLEEYYSWAEKHPSTLLYQEDRMRAHLKLAHEYFSM